MPYYIRDCNGQIVGNPKGYATFKGADRQASGVKTKAARAIWAAFDVKGAQLDKEGAPAGGRLIYTIKKDAGNAV